MGRAKLRMELISNKKARLKTLEKRKKGLEKCAHELSTLCGVDIAMIVYGSSEDKEPMVWPRNPQVISRMINSYKSISAYDCRYKTYNLSNFFKDKTEKVEQELQKLKKKRREFMYPTWDERYNTLSANELKDLGSVLMTKVDAVRERINLMKNSTSMGHSGSGIVMNQSFVPESWGFMQEFVQEQKPLVFRDPQVMTGFDEIYNNYDYSCDGNRVQNCGIGTEMENYGVWKDDEMMMVPYYDQPKLPMIQYDESLLLAQMQGLQEGNYVQRHFY